MNSDKKVRKKGKSDEKRKKKEIGIKERKKDKDVNNQIFSQIQIKMGHKS